MTNPDPNDPDALKRSIEDAFTGPESDPASLAPLVEVMTLAHQMQAAARVAGFSNGEALEIAFRYIMAMIQMAGEIADRKKDGNDD